MQAAERTGLRSIQKAVGKWPASVVEHGRERAAEAEGMDGLRKQSSEALAGRLQLAWCGRGPKRAEAAAGLTNPESLRN